MFEEHVDSGKLTYRVIDVNGRPLSDPYPTYDDAEVEAVNILRKSNWEARVFISLVDQDFGTIGDQEVFVA